MTTDDKFCLSTFDFEFAKGLDLIYNAMLQQFEAYIWSKMHSSEY